MSMNEVNTLSILERAATFIQHSVKYTLMRQADLARDWYCYSVIQ